MSNERGSRLVRRFRLAVLIQIAVLGAVTFAASACVHLIWDTEVRAVTRPATADTLSTLIGSPIKVHMVDGSTVLFRGGGEVTRDQISGSGEQFALLSDIGTVRSVVPMDSVLAVEAYDEKLLGVESLVLSAAATAVGAFAMAGLFVALFGSCPTLYADDGNGLALQAEGFSYAIAPLMEHRDVDPLRVQVGSDGVLRMELRNEALETHFINHVELLAVRHAPGQRVVPDQRGQPVTLDGFATLARATDRSGRDIRDVIAAHDGALYATPAHVMAKATVGDLNDWIDLDVSDLPPGDSVAVLLRLRNSLLNTVLLYEGMLGGRDAVDWLNTELQTISSTVDLARWYAATMGMHATMDGVATGSARMGDVGPIAFRDVALVLPRAAVDTTTARIRLRFVADNWRIDEVRVAGRMGRPTVAVLPVDSVVIPSPADGGAAVADAAAVGVLAAADDRYLETRPGQRLSLIFRADDGARAEEAETTYLIAWQGWYREWVRAAWLAAPTRTTAFVPGDEAMLDALRRWQAKKPAFEREFYASKIPVR